MGVYSSIYKPYGGSTAVGTFAVCCERGKFSHAACTILHICRAPSTSEGWLWRQQVWGYLHFAREVAWPPAMCFLLVVTVVGMDVGWSWAVCICTIQGYRVSSGQQVERHGRMHSVICSSNNSSGWAHGRNRLVDYLSTSRGARGRQVWSK